MEHTQLRFCKVPLQDVSLSYVSLRKDKKLISRAACCHLPAEIFVCMSRSWDILEYKLYSPNKLNGMQCFFLYGASEDQHQTKEWNAFLFFLMSYNRVAILRIQSYLLYILPPNLHKPHVEVLWEKRTNNARHGPESTVKNARARSAMPQMDSPVRTPSDLDQTVSPSIPCVAGPFSDAFAESGRATGQLHVEDVGESTQTTVRELAGQDNKMSCEGPTSFAGNIVELNVQNKEECAVPKNFVRTDPSYLRTLSQAHSGWIFGAIAELVDNSRDAEASKLYISVVSLYSKKAGTTIPVLSVRDDGKGMSHKEIVRMLSFGHKQPDHDDQDRIGRFGIGFKTGAMRLGRDAIVLTQNKLSRSIALLSQSLNEGKDDLEIPIVSYCKKGSFMEVDTSVVSEAAATYHLNAIREFSPFNEYFIGEKLAEFGESGTGTQIYIWNLDKWGSNYSLEWVDPNPQNQNSGDIIIRSRRVRSRPGQISHKVSLDFSLRSYMEVIFFVPRMKIYVQQSLVKCHPLAKFFSKTMVITDTIMGKSVELTLGYSQGEWECVNCGVFLYWHGRLIEAYKRVGGMVHNADMGRGVIGVIDVTSQMDDGNGAVSVLSNKQGFQDCEAYAKLEEWLGNRCDEYWDNHFDKLYMVESNSNFKPDDEWVQCEKCRKWRILAPGFDSNSLPNEWFCYMPPFNRSCKFPEQKVAPGVVTVGTKRTGQLRHVKASESCTDSTLETANFGDNSQFMEDIIPLKNLRRLRKCPVQSCKKMKK